MSVVSRMPRCLSAICVVLHIRPLNIASVGPTHSIILRLIEIHLRIPKFWQKVRARHPSNMRAHLPVQSIQCTLPTTHIEHYRNSFAFPRGAGEQRLPKEEILRSTILFRHARIPYDEIVFAVDAYAGECGLDGSHAALSEVGADEDHAESIEDRFHDTLEFQHVALKKVVSMPRRGTMPTQRHKEMIVRHHGLQQLLHQRLHRSIVHPRHAPRLRIRPVGYVHRALHPIPVPSVLIVDCRSDAFHQLLPLAQKIGNVGIVGLPGILWKTLLGNFSIVHVVIVIVAAFGLGQSRPIHERTFPLVPFGVIIAKIPRPVLVPDPLQLRRPLLPFRLAFVVGHF
mmetsp:Transcript_46172/g.96995  ORF Transcript_46172/g.96995 Transcript_46172/m.96995 type:complete len:341 (+) Transcript_46172:1460-2482(+)